MRKEQEEEARLLDKLREYNISLKQADSRLVETNRRLSELKNNGAQSQSAEQLLQQLQKDVRELAERKDNVENLIRDREIHLEKLYSWDSSDRMTTEDDVRAKRDQVNK